MTEQLAYRHSRIFQKPCAKCGSTDHKHAGYVGRITEPLRAMLVRMTQASQLLRRPSVAPTPMHNVGASQVH